MDISPRHRLFAVFVTAIAGVLSIVGIAFAQDDSVDVVLAVPRSQAVVGESLDWVVTLTPPSAASVSHISLSEAVPSLWEVAPKEVIDVLTGTKTLLLTSIPLTSGQLQPGLIVTYYVNGDRRELFVPGPQPVDVLNPVDLLTVTLLSPGTPVRAGDPVTLVLTLRNDTPFRMERTQLAGCGMGLDWPSTVTIGPVYPGTLVETTVTVTSTMAPAQPCTTATTSWSDARGVERQAVIAASSAVLPVRESFLVGVPRDILAIFLGIVASVLTTFLTRLVEQFLKRHQQLEMQWQQVFGLIQLTLLQAGHASERSVAVNLEPLTTLFQHEGLFEVMTRKDLAAPAQELWACATNYNEGLSRPNAPQRMVELKAAILGLRQALTRVRSG